jgi:hypothetical protein
LGIGWSCAGSSAFLFKVVKEVPVRVGLAGVLAVTGIDSIGLSGVGGRVTGTLTEGVEGVLGAYAILKPLPFGVLNPGSGKKKRHQ